MSCALLVIVALANPIVARPFHMPPVNVPRQVASRPASPPVALVAPATRWRAQPLATSGSALAALEARIAAARGLARIAALDAYTAALHELDDPDTLAAAYFTVLREPALARYPHAAELLFRAARTLGALPAAKLALERVLVEHPGSPFVVDAHLELADHAERERRFADTRKHLAAVIASKRPELVGYARLRLAFLRRLLRDHAGAVADLVAIARDPQDRHLQDATVGMLIAPLAEVAAPQLAPPLFDTIDRRASARWLRALAAAYAKLGKHAEGIATRRAAIAREVDPTLQCIDRADNVIALRDAPNRVDVEVAIAELAATVPFGNARCAALADHAVAELARTWHAAARPQDLRQLARVWARAVELATTPERKSMAEANRDLARAAAAARLP